MTILSLQKSGHAVWIYPRKKTVSVDGFRMFKITDKELEKLSPEELRAELRYLRAENAYLKKLKALVQSEKNGKKP